ncbi:MAG: hypothetical protein D8B48_08845 [Granulicatella sp.]|nr:MAG: hypothetical protein D8B48_08845 [Granulicatella sp.]
MSRVEELENEIKGLENRKLELLKQLELEKQKTAIDYPFAKCDDCWSIDVDGKVVAERWIGTTYNKHRFKLGNMFQTKKAAEKERDRRILLTRFRQFRDKCNRDFNPVDSNVEYYILFDYDENKLWITWTCIHDNFTPFGYFKNKEDAQHAIELFGDEIKRLWVEK